MLALSFGAGRQKSRLSPFDATQMAIFAIAAVIVRDNKFSVAQTKGHVGQLAGRTANNVEPSGFGAFVTPPPL
jgi:hypothetical protein